MTKPKQAADEAPRLSYSPKFLHDLRTPLNHIIGFSEMLTEQAQEEEQTGFVSDLQNIHLAARQMLELLNGGVPVAVVGSSGHESARVAKSGIGPAEAEQETTAGKRRALILVVDDNKVNRDMLSRRLKRQGYGVAMAENGRQALAAARAEAFDLILLDIMMPEMDGYEALQELKADEALRHIPVVMISALTEMDSVVRCIEMGADDYLSKPFDPTLLKARIGASLDKKEQRDREVTLYEQLQQNYKRLQELEKQRDDLTNMIVHDLRTPLSSLIGGMQTLEAGGDLDGFQQEMVGISISGGQTLLGMINDLLDVEKMESGSMPLDYTKIDAAALVDSAESQIASLLSDKSLTLIKQIPGSLPPFRADENKLRRVLVNLVGNAIKFTPSGGTVTVEAGASKDGLSVLFSVRDTGEGIPAEAFVRIFEKFGQVESRQGGRTMSTGLGLAFCKLAVEAHGGAIDVKSVPGVGSTFSFTIPVAVRSTVSFAVIHSKESGASDDRSWFYNTLLSLGDAIIATDGAGKVIFMNPIAESLTGWKSKDAIGKDVAGIYQAIDESSGEAVQRFLVDIAGGEDVIAVKVDMELVARDGSHISIHDTAAPIKDALGQTTGVVVVFRDTTQQRDVHRNVKAFNERLRNAMAETNHRVKNNLQVIAALVDLQAEEGDGGFSTSAKQKLGLHIRTLANIHEFLTEEAKTSEDLTFVSASETLAKLIPMVQATVAQRLVSFSGDTVRLHTKQSSSLALIVNELISNALKHGKGSVDVLLVREGDTAVVEVLDDGEGFPGGFDLKSSASNGLALVAGLVKTDLAGILEFSNRAEGGGCVSVRFPIETSR